MINADIHNKTVFVISYCFPTEANPQSGIFVFDQCRLLKREGVNIVVLNVANTAGFSMPKIKKWGEIDVVECAICFIGHSFLPRITTKIYQYFFRKLFKVAVSKFGKPEVIYAHFSFPTGFVAKALAMKYNISYVVMEHSSMFNGKHIPKYVRKNIPALVNQSRAFMCVSNSLKASLSRIAPRLTDKIDVVYNAIDSYFCYIPKQKKTGFVLFSAGNLMPIKQYDVLIHAISVLSMRGIEVSLRIAGEGLERDNLIFLIKRLQLEKNITLLGRLNKEDILHELSTCDAFVLASRSETFGVAFREAMFVGRPVISFDNGGIREGWNNDYGVIVPTQDAESLAQAIEQMKIHYRKFNLEEISKKSHEMFDEKKIVERLIFLLFKHVK